MATSANVVVRDESATDFTAIFDVTVAAFSALEISSHTEQFVIAALREAGALTISLVAELEKDVVGHIAFSPVTMTDGTEGWYGLGPVSVHPDVQRRGVGSALVNEGLSRLKGLGAAGCCLVGHPRYYRRFGFRNVDGLAYRGVPPKFFFILPFDGRVPQGHVLFHKGFSARE